MNNKFVHQRKEREKLESKKMPNNLVVLSDAPHIPSGGVQAGRICRFEGLDFRCNFVLETLA